MQNHFFDTVKESFILMSILISIEKSKKNFDENSKNY